MPEYTIILELESYLDPLFPDLEFQGKAPPEPQLIFEQSLSDDTSARAFAQEMRQKANDKIPHYDGIVYYYTSGKILRRIA
ncbi:Uncharacterised protein [uncultured archaeon]|nr:Uncharacterised protein [uncultured archaeon]